MEILWLPTSPHTLQLTLERVSAIRVFPIVRATALVGRFRSRGKERRGALRVRGTRAVQSNFSHFLVGGMAIARYVQDGMREVVALFMHEDRRLTAALLVRPADSQRVHAVLEHPSANSQEVGGMGLNVVGPFEGV